MKTLTGDYEPFGSEWEKEMMKWTKPAMIDHLKTLLKERLSTDALLAEKDKECIELNRMLTNREQEVKILRADVNVLEELMVINKTLIENGNNLLAAKEAELEALREVFQMMAAAYNDMEKRIPARDRFPDY